MLFNSATFIWEFLLPVLAIFYVVARLVGARAALGVLVVASLVFYGWSHPLHVLVLLGSIVANYFLAGRLIGQERRSLRLGLLWLGLSLNLGILIWFKYAVFFAGILRDATGWGPTLAALVMPLGISFFTFQKIAYLVDAYHRKFTRQNWADYALFVTFFPQLIAGPITHHTEIVPQLHGGEFARWRGDRMLGGVAIFILGLGKKVVLADSFAPHADAVFGQFATGHATGFFEGWAGALAYAFQIYFDFSGYTDMAFGLALLFGITLPENFAAPYRATSIIEFWRRWHMTLSRFLRDYLYVPLGGSRDGRGRQMVNLLIVMLLGGLWHGAAWTFVIWGVVHGLALAVNHGWRQTGQKLSAGMGWLLTFGLVVSAWVFFRAAGVFAACRGLRALYGGEGLWPEGITDGVHWLNAQVVAPGFHELSELLGYLDLTASPGHTGAEWRFLLCSESAVRAWWLLVGFGLVVFRTPAIRWMWNFETASPRLDARRALVVGAVLFCVMVTGSAEVASSFIYFRF